MTVTYLQLAPAVCSQSGSGPSPAMRRTQEGPTGPETALPFRRRRGQHCGNWERLALVLTILGPPSVLLLLIGFMAVEGKYAQEARFSYLGHDRNAVALSPSDIHGEGVERGEEGAH